MVERRNISDLADPSIDNTLPNELVDWDFTNTRVRSYDTDPLTAAQQLPVKPDDRYTEFDLRKPTIGYIVEDGESIATGIPQEILNAQSGYDFPYQLIYTINGRYVWAADITYADCTPRYQTGSKVLVLPIEGIQNYYIFIPIDAEPMNQAYLVCEWDGTNLTVTDRNYDSPIGADLPAPFEEGPIKVEMINDRIVVSAIQGYIEIEIVYDNPQGGFIVAQVTNTGGSPGDESTQCSYTYEYTEISTGRVLTSVPADPTTDGFYNRPPVGSMIVGTIALIHDNRVLMVNEQIDAEACP